jgi:hypothetical protein
MLKSSLIAACLLGSVALGANVAYADDAKPTAPQAKPAVPKPKVGCTHDTGSRLPRADGCLGVGRSYSQDDISRTGQPSVGGALRLMDPSITSR